MEGVIWMKIKMLSRTVKLLSTLILCLLLLYSLAFPGFANNLANDGPFSDELFIEHNAETGTDVYFSLQDVLINSKCSTPDKLEEVVLDDGSSYTLPCEPSNLREGVVLDSSITELQADTDSLLPGSSLHFVDNVNVAPYCKTVIIAMKFQKADGTFTYTTGSGAMVGNRVLLTAGHVIYHTNLHLEPYEIRVFIKSAVTVSDTDPYPQKTMFDQPGYYHAQSWVFSANFKPSGDPNYDWCYLTMFDNIGSTYTGWYGIGYSASNLSNISTSVNGYPDQNGKRYHQYTSSGSLDSTSAYRVRHTCSTLGGQSGAPLYSPSYVVWGIHTHGTSDNIYNHGTRLTNSLYTLLVNKINETN